MRVLAATAFAAFMLLSPPATAHMPGECSVELHAFVKAHRELFGWQERFLEVDMADRAGLLWWGRKLFELGETYNRIGGTHSKCMLQALKRMKEQ